jgi:hypothetical protein
MTGQGTGYARDAMARVRLTLTDDFDLAVGDRRAVPHSARAGGMRSAWVVVRGVTDLRQSLARAWMAAPSWRLMSILMRTERASLRSCY